MSEPLPSDHTLTQKTTPSDASVQQIYINGFEINISLSDFNITLMTHDRKLAYLLMSFSTAKTLSEGLTQAIRTLEKTTGREIMTMNDVKQAIEPQRKEPAS